MNNTSATGIGDVCKNAAGQIFDCIKPETVDTNFVEYTLWRFYSLFWWSELFSIFIIIFLIAILFVLSSINDKLETANRGKESEYD